jgi:hypothetical protein
MTRVFVINDLLIGLKAVFIFGTTVSYGYGIFP